MYTEQRTTYCFRYFNMDIMGIAKCQSGNNLKILQSSNVFAWCEQLLNKKKNHINACQYLPLKYDAISQLCHSYAS